MNTKNPKPSFQYCSFSASDKTIIKKDWATLLKDMDWIRGFGSRPLFQRMVGPLLIRIGFSFKQLTGDCEIGYSVRNLAYYCKERGEDFSDSFFSTELESIYNSISPRDYKYLYIGAFENLKNIARIPIEGDVSLNDILIGYQQEAKERDIIWNLGTYNYRIYADDRELDKGILSFSFAGAPALVAAWAGESEKAQQYLDWGCKVFKEDDKPLGTKAEFRKFHEELISKPEDLRKIVEKNIINHKEIQQAPYQDIADASYKKPIVEPILKKKRSIIVGQTLPTKPFTTPHITALTKELIIKNWALLLPDMKWTKGLGLRSKDIIFQRMVGPLLIEIILTFKINPDRVIPIYSVLNLAYNNIQRNEKFFDSGNCFPLLSIFDYIKPPSQNFAVLNIDNKLQNPEDLHLLAFERLKKSSILPIVKDLSVDYIFNHYNEKLKNIFQTLPIAKDVKVCQFKHAGIPALVAAWAGEPEKAEEYLDWGCKVFKEDDKPLGTKAEFRKFHEEMISDPEALRQIVEDNIAKGDGGYNYFPEIMRQAPYQDIDGAAYKKPKPGT
jgi:hypothetical protein